LTARVAEDEIRSATGILGLEARSIFRRQTTQDQRHALAVYAALRGAGHTNPDLLRAALLHDVGKAAAGLTLWWRTVIVLLSQFTPRLLARLSGENRRERARDNSSARPGLAQDEASIGPSGGRSDWFPPAEVLLDRTLPACWKRPLVAHARHPEIGADWARAAGCSALTVNLIRRHQERLVGCCDEEDRLLAALQAADGRN
jgi:hypothetical protein